MRAERLLSAQILMHSAWGARKKFSLYALHCFVCEIPFWGPCLSTHELLVEDWGSYILEKGYRRTAILPRDSRDFPGKVNHGLEGGLTLPHSGSANIGPGFHSLDTQVPLSHETVKSLKRF